MLRPQVSPFLARAGAVLAAGLLACSADRGAPPTIVIPAGDPLPVLGSGPSPTASSSAAAPREAPPIAWMTSEPDARDRARRAGLPLLVWARAEWAAAALEMERKVWTDPRVREAARPFVALRLDLTETEGDAQRYAERYDVTGVPSTILFDARGRRVATLIGSRSPEAVVEALQRAAE